MDPTYDPGRLTHEEVRELRALQFKMIDETGDPEGFSALSLDELKSLERLYKKMASLPADPERKWNHLNDEPWQLVDGKYLKMNGEPYLWEWEPPAGHVPVIARESSGVAAASGQPAEACFPGAGKDTPEPAQPAEPAAIAPSTAPA